MASIAFRNSSRRLLRAYFSKLGWQANVIWRIAFFNQLQVYPSWLWRSDLFRASLDLASKHSVIPRFRIFPRPPDVQKISENEQGGGTPGSGRGTAENRMMRAGMAPELL